MDAVSDADLQETEQVSFPVVLIIDDEMGPRESMRMLLKPVCTVFCAAGVREGIAILKRETPDCVIMDIRMPGMDGIEGLKLLRSLDPDVSVIMLTGYGTLETAREAIRLGANDYLKKPFDAVEMEKIVGENIRRTELARRKRIVQRHLRDLNQTLLDEVGQNRELAALGQASRELAHDLQNPLTIVMGSVNLLSYELKKLEESGLVISGPGEQATDYLQVIENSLIRCRELLQAWRNLGQESGIQLENLHLHRILKPVMSEVRAMAMDRMVLLNEDIRIPTSQRVLVDPLQFPRVVFNLVSNAFESLPEHGGWIRVEVEVQGDRLWIQVQDNGCGMTEEEAKHAFHASFTTKQEQGGSGLGLTITRRILEQHGGGIEFETLPGKGSTFKAWIPAVMVGE